MKFFIRAIGVLFVLLGFLAAYYGPLEISVFYLFSEGGPFHFPGFGVGSVWFAALVLQNIGYYVVAAILIPLGIGHIKLRPWALTLTRLYTWFWLGAGVWLISNLVLAFPFFLKLDIGRDILMERLIIILVIAIIFLVVLPVLVLYIYKNEKIKMLFEAKDEKTYWLEKYPFPLLIVLLLFVFTIIGMHILIFLQGAFPIFGQIMLGRPSVHIITSLILVLSIIGYGIVQLNKWAWWGALGYFSLLAISSVMTFSSLSLYDFFRLLYLPKHELEVLDNLTILHEYHFVGLIIPPLILILGLLIYSKRYFKSNGKL